jgi:sec-independent protein translocase protein TatC
MAIPIITYQLLMFVLPGLTTRERRYVLTAMPAITLLFLVGAAFAWFIMTPPALGFLQSFEADIFKPEWTAELYLAFVTALVFWMGVAFETPLIFFVLSLLGLVGPGVLIKHWRIAVVVAAIAAAVITPTVDPVNMFMVMGPLLILYALSIVLVTIGRRMAKVDVPVG